MNHLDKNTDQLFKNVQNLRQKLQATERNLQNFDYPGHGLPTERFPRGQAAGPVFSTPEKSSALRRADIDESREIQELLSADGSYQAVERTEKRSKTTSITSSHKSMTSQPTASATSRRQMSHDQSQSKQTLQQNPAFKPPLELRTKLYRSLDSSQNSRADVLDASVNSRASDAQSRSSRIGRDAVSRHSPVDFTYEVPAVPVNQSRDPGDELRMRIQRTREESAQLLRHNHALLNQLEDLTMQHHKLQQQKDACEEQLTRQEATVSELQERVVCLQSDSDSHEKALRDAEDRCEDYERALVSGESSLKQHEAEIEQLRNQLAESEVRCDKVEAERDKTLETAESLHSQFEDYQRKTRLTTQELERKLSDHVTRLSHMTEERQVLVQNAESSQAAILSLQQQLREWEDETRIERENRNDVETHNSELRSHVAQLQHANAKLENSVRDKEGLKQEVDSLRMSNQEYRQKLHQCQVTIGESQAELARLEAGLTNQSTGNNDSGTESQKKASKVIITQLRSEVENKNAEIQGLRKLLENQTLAQRPVEAPTSLSDQPRGDKLSEQAESRIAELESMLLKLEDERGNHLAEVASLQEKINDLDIEVKGHESKVKHRNNQVTELQKELSEKVNKVTTLEREVRKRSAQLDSLERQLHDKSAELADQSLAADQLQTDLTAKSEQLIQLRHELEGKMDELTQQKAMSERMRALHAEQCDQLDKQIKQLETHFAEKEQYMRDQERCVTSLQSQLRERDDELTRVNTLAKQEISRKISENESVLHKYEMTAQQATAQVQKLESALLMCKEELNVYLEQYQQTKYSHGVELAARDKQIDAAERARDDALSLVRERDQQLTDAEQSAADQVHMLQMNSQRVTELEETSTALQQQISELEQELHSEKTRSEAKQLSHDEQLTAAQSQLQNTSSQLQQSHVTIQQLKAQISAAEADKASLSGDVARLEAELSQERSDTEHKMAALREKERELSVTKARVKDEQETVAELEEKLEGLRAEMKEKGEQHSTLQVEFQSLSNQLAESQIEVDQLNAELTERKKHIEQQKITIRRKEDEISSKDRELEEMTRELEQRDWTLRTRAAELVQLEMGVKEHRAAQEQQLIRVQAQLSQAKLEAQQKHKQLSDMEARLAQAHSEVQEKCSQLQHAEQASRKAQQQLRDKHSHASDMETQMQVMRQRLESCITENSEMGHELTSAREDVKKVHSELAEAKRQLSVSKREQDKWKSEYQAVLNQYQDSEVQLKSVKEELSRSRLHGEELETHTGVELRRLVQEVDAMRTRHEAEMKEVAKRLLSQKQVEEALREKIRDLESSCGHVRAELETCESQSARVLEQLRNAQMCITELQGKLALKEAEIARLQGRLHGLERSSNQAHAPQKPRGLTGHSQGHYQGQPQNAASTTSKQLSDNINTNLIDFDIEQQSQGQIPDKAQGRSSMPWTEKFAGSQDDSIVSLLDRMRMHEQHVTEVLQERISLDTHPAQLDTLIVPRVPNLHDNHTPSNQLLSNAESRGSQSVLDSTNQYQLFQSDVNIPSFDTNNTLNASQQHKRDTAPISSSVTSAEAVMQLMRSLQIAAAAGSRPGTATAAHPLDPLESSAAELAASLARDPNSFQTLFDQLKHRYMGTEQNRSNAGSNQNDSRSSRDHSVSFMSDVVVTRNFNKPDKDTVLSTGTSSDYPSRLRDTLEPMTSLVDKAVTSQEHNSDVDSTISVINESDSIAVNRRLLAQSDSSTKHYTSSPKLASKTRSVVTKPGKPIKSQFSSSMQGQRAGFTKGTKSSTSKVVKKGTGTSFFGGAGSKRASKNSAQSKSVNVKSRTGYEAVTSAKSPADQPKSPNVSTAIAHYASDLDQSENSIQTGADEQNASKQRAPGKKKLLSDLDLDTQQCMALLQERRRALEARKLDLNSHIRAAEAELASQSAKR